MKNNIWKMYLFQILYNLMFFTPVIVLYWQEIGLNMTEIMLLQSFFAITIVALEVPTGYLADIFGRKNSLIACLITSIIGLSIYTAGYNFWWFLTAEFFWGISASLLSGSDSAIVYDTLINLKKENEYKKIWGRILSFRFITIAAATIIGGWLGTINYRLTLGLMIPFHIILIPFTISMKEPKRYKLIIKKGYVKKLWQIMKELVLKNPQTRWLFIYAGVIYGFNQAAFWLYQPYLKITGLDIIYFGVVFSSFQIIAAISSHYAYKIENFFGKKNLMYLLLLLSIICFLLMRHFVFLFSFSFAFLIQISRGIMKPLFADYTNKLVGSDIRATALSSMSLVKRLIYAIIIPIIGYFVDAFSLLQTFTIITVAIIIFGSISLFMLHKDKVI